MLYSEAPYVVILSLDLKLKINFFANRTIFPPASISGSLSSHETIPLIFEHVRFLFSYYILLSTQLYVLDKIL